MTEATIEIIIVTAFVNVLVTGIVASLIFYRYQKNIDLSMGKKLEEFKADLQLSNFQEQTKFSRNYPKMLDVLEICNQKYIGFRETSIHFADWVLSIRFKFDTISSDEIDRKIQQVSSALVDFQSYFRANRIHLPDQSIKEIEEILLTAWVLRSLLLATTYIADMTNDDLAKFVKVMPEIVNLENIETDNKSFPYSLIRQVCKGLISLSEQLEKHYKLVADLTQ